MKPYPAMATLIVLLASAGSACGGPQTNADSQRCGAPYAAGPLDLGQTPPSEPIRPADTPRSECPSDTNPDG